MNNTYDGITKDSWNTIIIGGGQAGLAAGYYLSLINQDFIILDALENAGDSWRNRWDSLRLFTPAWNNGLPGMPFPGDAEKFPTKDEVADFLNQYKEKFDLPVMAGQRVIQLYKTVEGYNVKTEERTFFAHSVIVTTGGYIIPKIPVFANRLNPSVNQLHSSQYTTPGALAEGDVLVVGAGTSGLQIAMDLVSDKRRVFVSGKPPVRIPDFIFKYVAKQFVWFATNILNTSTPMGRKAQRAIKTKGGGAPLINISLKEVINAGVEHLSRITETRDGWPVSADGKIIKAANIVWATGFLPDYSWIDIPGILDEQGYPLANRGVSQIAQGLYFVGSMFQYGLTSTWIAGVGRDAEFISQQVDIYNQTKKRKAMLRPY